MSESAFGFLSGTEGNEVNEGEIRLIRVIRGSQIQWNRTGFGSCIRLRFSMALPVPESHFLEFPTNF